MAGARERERDRELESFGRSVRETARARSDRAYFLALPHSYFSMGEHVASVIDRTTYVVTPTRHCRDLNVNPWRRVISFVWSFVRFSCV